MNFNINQYSKAQRDKIFTINVAMESHLVKKTFNLKYLPFKNI